MKKFLKIFAISFASLIGLLYLSFVFVLPHAIDIEKFKPELQKIAQEQAKLNIDFNDAKIITTPMLGVGISAKDISIKLPDESVLFSADSIKTRVALPSLLTLTIKVSCLEIEEPFVNLEIADEKNFKIVHLVENILNTQKEKVIETSNKTTSQKESKVAFDPSIIKIKIPAIKLKEYEVLINDLTINHYLKLKGDELVFGYFNGKAIKLKTEAKLFSDENENISANINIKTTLPKFETKLDEEDDPANRVEIPFVNPVKMYRNYDLHANLDTKMSLRLHKNPAMWGHFNLEDVDLKVSHLKLPKSYVKLRGFNTNLWIDSDINPAKNQDLKLFGRIHYGKKPNMDLNIKTAKIYFNDLLILSKAFLDSLHIKNELDALNAKGHLIADCNIKTNFKKLKSNGYIKVVQGSLDVREYKNILSSVNINMLFDDNALTLDNSTLSVNNSPIKINGFIDKKANTQIKINADKISLPSLFYAFAPKDLREAFNFPTGDLNFNFNVEGKLKNATAQANLNLDNFNFGDKKETFKLLNKELTADFLLDKNALVGNIDNADFNVLMPKTKSKINLDKVGIEVTKKDITITQNKVKINDNSEILYSGFVKNYLNPKEIVFNSQGSLDTKDLVKIIGEEFKPFINSKGAIPVKFTLEGNKKKQTLFAQALGDTNNFITPIDLNSLVDKNSSIQTIVDFKPGRIKIKKTGLYERITTIDKKGNEVISLNEILGIDGTIAGDKINLLKINLPKELAGKIYVFPNSNFKTQGHLFVFGQMAQPRIIGNFRLSELNIPELFLSATDGLIKFSGHRADFGVKNVEINNSDLAITGKLGLIPAPVLNVWDLKVNSNKIDVDKLLKVAQVAMKYVPQAPTSQNTNAQTADIPIKLASGQIDMKNIKSGNIEISNTISDISLDKNIFYLDNLTCDIFNGKVLGDISVNLLTSLLDINVKGRNVDVEKALLDAANMKDTLSGEADFSADITLEGATYEQQMKSLKGDVEFSVKDGQFGPFGKIENLIIAENIRESQFFQTALGGVINSLTTIDTTHFSELNGKMSFNDGICHIEPITSLGNILSLHIFGDFDLLKNHADLKIRARMASIISNLLGPISAINPVNLLNSVAGLNVVTAKAFSLFCETVSEEELANLPSFSNKYVDNAAMKFQLVARGDVAKPLTLIKSFKWLATTIEFDKANNYITSLPEPIEGSSATTVEEMLKEVEAFEQEKKTLKYKIKNIFKKKETI